MKNTPKVIPDKIHIVEYKQVKFQVESYFEFDKAELKGFETSFDFEIGFNTEAKLAKTDFKVKVKTDSAGSQTDISGFFHFAFIYAIDNFDELVKPAEEKIESLDIEGELAITLASITYSTVRGLLMAQLNNTDLERFILKIVNPKELLEQK
jgi:hypothetical protein